MDKKQINFIVNGEEKLYTIDDNTPFSFDIKDATITVTLSQEEIGIPLKIKITDHVQL